MINGIDRGQYPLARSSSPRRVLDLQTWTASGIPLLRDPREFVLELHQRHLPQPGTVVVAVLDALHRLTGSASFAPRPHNEDGWLHRNAILTHLRQVVPHDLRLPTPTRTAVLLSCREGAAGWTEQDGAWMWALQDAAALHGLRCGAYVALTPVGWQILGDGRSGRNPNAASWADGPVHTVTELPPRSALDGQRGQRTLRQAAPERPRRGERPQRSRQSEHPWTPARVTAIEPTRRTGTR
ncbi:hypothetical protein [Streptomyces sp. BE20]|uniref:hypothetical protein n=1 Tax=Streptomyces sp. BE20 TaxID=3002525 RepID=UPI002E799B77|nr:hypothetical protein [Streptomyces sp. BE20]